MTLREFETLCDTGTRPGPEVINLFSCSTQLTTTFILLINVKMPTIVGILTYNNLRKNGIKTFSISHNFLTHNWPPSWTPS